MSLLLPIAVTVLVVLATGVAALLIYLYSLELTETPVPEHPPARSGIWFMSHRADDKRRFPFQHTFLRITPRDPQWLARHPEIFRFTDDQGSAFATLGAGPEEGRLVAGFNRPTDVEVPIRFEEPVSECDVAEENRRIEKLIEAFQSYPNNLRFSAWRPVSGPGYNCHALMAAFALRAGLQRPRFAKAILLCPGIGKPVPLEPRSQGLHETPNRRSR